MPISMGMTFPISTNVVVVTKFAKTSLVPEKFGQAYSWSRLFSVSEGQVGAYGNPQYADYWTAECWGARIPQSDGDTQTMDAAFGDVNGDGLLDIMCTDWTDKADDVVPSYNVTGRGGNHYAR